MTVTPMPIPTGSASTIVEDLLPSVVTVIDGHGAGAGVIWHPDGLIITNAHVAASDELSVILFNHEQLNGRLIARDEELDLALVSVERHELPAAPRGDSASIRVGQLVVAIGHPLGVANAVSVGIINQEPNPETHHLLAQIHLDRGNSGGPLLDAHGRVLGINTMVVTDGIGLAIRSEVVEQFLEAAISEDPHWSVV